MTVRQYRPRVLASTLGAFFTVLVVCMPRSFADSSSLRTSVALHVGWRYVTRTRRQTFGRLVNVFSFMAMTLGVMSLIVVLSVMNGFGQELTGRFLSVLPEAALLTFERETPELAGVEDVGLLSSPTLEATVIVSARDVQHALTLMAVDPNTDGAVADVPSQLIEGDWDGFGGEPFRMVLGVQTANALGVRVGDSVNVQIPAVRVLPTGIYPRRRGFQVAAIFGSNSQADADFALVRLEDANALFKGVYTQRGVRLRGQQSQYVALQQAAGDSWALIPWQARMQGLYEAMQLEKKVVTSMLMAIILIASFSLVASLVMTVADKRTDVAVLRTMGASERQIVLVFLFQGMLFGGLGILIGVTLGCLIAVFFSDIAALFERVSGQTVFDPNVFYVSYLPTDLQWGDVVTVVIAALIVTFIAACVPARQAARIAPAEAIHYNQ